MSICLHSILPSIIYYRLWRIIWNRDECWGSAERSFTGNKIWAMMGQSEWDGESEKGRFLKQQKWWNPWENWCRVRQGLAEGKYRVAAKRQSARTKASLVHHFFVVKLFIPSSEVFALSSLVGPPWSCAQSGFNYTVRVRRKTYAMWEPVWALLGCSDSEMLLCAPAQLSALPCRKKNTTAHFLPISPSVLPWKEGCMEKWQCFALKCSQGKPPRIRVAWCCTHLLPLGVCIIA